ncbi:hypothetical protein [Kribbella speibonae]|uniref:Uncharacterized protein n=1 Tax=Kribbella speibonae TaxID=1572660 RepID=A0A4R0IT14_9ACTN|nr:hypothetical protein [Kribbella speibonae]TCC36329.1 hypothetical protein E0H92_27140 [Kribbella speibonae]
MGLQIGGKMRNRIGPAAGGRYRIAGSTLWWIVATLLASAGIPLVISTSVAADQLPPPVFAPDYARPAIAAALPQEKAVSDLFGQPAVRIMSGLPSSRAFASSSPFAQDALGNAVKNAWDEVWQSTDGRFLLHAQILEAKSGQKLTVFGQGCRPERPPRVAVTADQAGELGGRGGREAFCIVVERNGARINLSLARPTGGETDAWKQFAALAQSSVTRMPVVRTEQSGYVDMHRVRTLQNRYFLLAPLAVALLAWLFGLVDRATWQRLLSLLRPHRSRAASNFVDLEPVSRRRRWRARALGSLRLLLYVCAIRLAEVVHWGTYKTVAFVFVIALSVMAVETFLARRTVARPQHLFAGKRRLLMVGAALGSGIVVLGAIALAMTGAAMAAIGYNPVGTDLQVQRMGLVMMLAAPLVALLALAPMAVARRLAMRILRSETLADPRPPVLLLRSFADDRRKVRSRSPARAGLIDRLSLRRWERFEEVLAARLSRVGPPLAVGQVGERMPPQLGAVRRQFTDDEWRDQVGTLMADASMICVTVGRSQALSWEIRRIQMYGLLGKAVFVLPPTGSRECKRRLAVLAELLDIPWELVDPTGLGRRVLAVTCPSDSPDPVVLTAAAQDDLGYDCALEAAVLLTRGVTSPNSEVAAVIEADRRRSAPAARRRRNPPPVVVYPTGKTPKYRPLIPRWFVRTGGLGLGGILTSVIAFTVGANADDVQSIDNPLGGAVTLAEQPTTGALFAAGSRTVIRVDFNRHRLTKVATLDTTPTQLAAAQDALYALDSAAGTLTAVDATSGQVRWKLSNISGYRALKPVGDSLYAADPVNHRIVRIRPSDGHRKFSPRLTGTPWDIAHVKGSLYVAFPDLGQVQLLTGSDLRPSTALKTDKPVQLAVTGDRIWSRSGDEPKLTALPAYAAPRSSELLLKVQPAALNSDGTTMAVEGYERVTIMRPNGALQRIRSLDQELNAVVLTREGSLFEVSPEHFFLAKTTDQ